MGGLRFREFFNCPFQKLKDRCLLPPLLPCPGQPDNFLWTGKDCTGQLKLADFGLSELLSESVGSA